MQGTPVEPKEIATDKAIPNEAIEADKEKQNQDVHMQSTPGSVASQKNDDEKKDATPGSGESPMTEEDVPSKFEEEKVSKPRIGNSEPHDLFFRRVLHLAA